MQKSLDDLACYVNGAVIGDSNVIINDVADIEKGQPGCITFLSNPKFRKHLKSTNASAVLVSRDIAEKNINLLQVDDPYYAFCRVLRLFHPLPEAKETFIHDTAVISKNSKIEHPVHVGAYAVIEDGAEIEKNTTVGAHSYIGKNVKIGSRSYLHPRVTILYDCVVGSEVIIHSGTVIGSDGFGFAEKDGKYLKIPQIGNVVVKDFVEIGANCAIDRAALGSTTIEAGCKLDNLIHIAHNVEIGENTALAGQTGIAGSAKIGKNVKTGGQVGIIGHITIGDYSMLGAKSAAFKSIPEKSYYMASPARDHKLAKRLEVYFKKLPELFNKIRDIEKKLDK